MCFINLKYKSNTLQCLFETIVSIVSYFMRKKMKAELGYLLVMQKLQWVATLWILRCPKNCADKRCSLESKIIMHLCEIFAIVLIFSRPLCHLLCIKIILSLPVRLLVLCRLLLYMILGPLQYLKTENSDKIMLSFLSLQKMSRAKLQNTWKWHS